MNELAKAMLKVHEGLRLKMYKCSEGYNTIGYGFNLDANEIPESVADTLLEVMMEEVEEECATYGYWDELTEGRQAILIDLCYCVGPAGFGGFKKMHKALHDADYPEAAAQIMDSKFAVQTGRRAKELSELMVHG